MDPIACQYLPVLSLPLPKNENFRRLWPNKIRLMLSLKVSATMQSTATAITANDPKSAVLLSTPPF